VGSNGYISYTETCTFLRQNETQITFDLESREPYAYNGKDWITFANEQSTKEKVDDKLKSQPWDLSALEKTIHSGLNFISRLNL